MSQKISIIHRARRAPALKRVVKPLIMLFIPRRRKNNYKIKHKLPRMPGYISFFLCLSCNVWWLGSGRWSLEHRWQCVFILTWQGLITSLQPSHWQQFIYPQLLFLEHLKPECLRFPVGWSGFFLNFLSTSNVPLRGQRLLKGLLFSQNCVTIRVTAGDSWINCHTDPISTPQKQH